MKSFLSKRALSIALVAFFIAMTGCGGEQNNFRGFTFSVNVADEGSKSESRTGRLAYKNADISSHLAPISTPIGTFNFVSSPVPWGEKGWQRGESLTTASSSDNFMTTEDGRWFFGGKKIGTPETFCYVQNKNAWVNPDFFDEFVKSQYSGAAPAALEIEGLVPASAAENTGN